MADEIYTQPQIFENNVTLNGPLTSNDTAVFNGVVTYNNDFIINDDLDVQNSLFVGGSADIGNDFYDKVNITGKVVGKTGEFGQPGEFYTDGVSALVLTQDFDFSKQNENRVVLFNDAETLQASKRSNILDFIQNVDGIEGISLRIAGAPYGNPVGQYSDTVFEVPMLSGMGTPTKNLSTAFMLFHGGDNRLGTTNNSWTNVLGNLSVTNDIVFDGNLTVKKNLSVLGDLTYLDTVVSVTSALSVVNTGTGPAAKIIQTGNQPIVEFWDDTTNALKINNDYRVSFYNSNASNKFTLAGGNSTTASGSAAFAWGEQAVASGKVSTAFGFSSASGDYSTSFGYRSLASGGGSIAIGQDTLAQGAVSLAGGGGNSFAKGNGSIAFGNSVQALGFYSTALGTGSVAFDSYALATGNGTAALGQGSFSTGYVTVAGGNYSFVNGSTNTTGLRIPFTYDNTTAVFSFSPAFSALTNVSPGTYFKVYDANVGFYVNYTVVVASRSSVNGSISATADYIGIPSSGYILLPNVGGVYATSLGGEFNNASGYGSVVIGGQTSEARGLFSYALGVNSIAEGENSYAIGTNAFTPTNRSMVIKLGNTTEPVSSTRMGQFILSAVGGSYIPGSVGIGTDNISNALTVQGTLSTLGRVLLFGSLSAVGSTFLRGTLAQGLFTSAYGINSFAQGDGSYAHGNASYAGGIYSFAGSDNSIAFGYEAATTEEGAFSFGANNIVSNRFSCAIGSRNAIGTKVFFSTYNNVSKTMTFASSVSAKFNYITPGAAMAIFDSGLNGSLFGIVSSRNASSGAITFVNDPYGGNLASTGVAWAVAREGISEGGFVVGIDNEARRTASFAAGGANIANGEASFAMGDSCTANNLLTFAFGSLAYADHDYSFVWSGSPTGAKTTQTNQIVLSAPGGVFLPGNVGIGTDSVANALTVNGSISARNNITSRGNITFGITTLSALSATTLLGTVTAATGTITDKFLQISVEGQTFGIPLYTLS
jgi:hypothetical protein